MALTIHHHTTDEGEVHLRGTRRPAAPVGEVDRVARVARCHARARVRPVGQLRPVGPVSGVSRHVPPRSPRLLAAAVLTTLTVLGLIALPGLRLPRADAPGPPAVTELHVVGPGDTMWSLAAAHLPAEPRAQAIDRLRTLNGDHELRPGDVVVVPVAGR